MSFRLTLMLALAIGSFGVGCGENEAPSPSKEEFVAKAGATCLRVREGAFNRIAAYTKAHRSEGLSQPALLKAATKAVLVQTAEAELAALRDLQPPSGQEAEVEGILDAAQEAIDEAKRREEKARTARDVTKTLGATDKQLRAYGLERCHKGL